MAVLIGAVVGFLMYRVGLWLYQRLDRGSMSKEDYDRWRG
jgi:hypothetical protein